MPRIFISYRRADSASAAGRLYDHLSQHFGEANVFMDIADIPPGADFVRAIEDEIGGCDVVLTVIGPQWLAIMDDNGQRRIDDPEDFVRLEIETALAGDQRVIPILVEGAQMPTRDDLPGDLKPLSRINALALSNNRFKADVDRLVRLVERPPSARKVVGSRARTPSRQSTTASPKREPFRRTPPPKDRTDPGHTVVQPFVDSLQPVWNRNRVIWWAVCLVLLVGGVTGSMSMGSARFDDIGPLGLSVWLYMIFLAVPAVTIGLAFIFPLEGIAAGLSLVVQMIFWLVYAVDYKYGGGSGNSLVVALVVGLMGGLLIGGLNAALVGLAAGVGLRRVRRS
jgi:hypothetical protein